MPLLVAGKREGAAYSNRPEARRRNSGLREECASIDRVAVRTADLVLRKVGYAGHAVRSWPSACGVLLNTDTPQCECDACDRVREVVEEQRLLPT